MEQRKKNVRGAAVEEKEKGGEVTGGRHAVGPTPAVVICGRSWGRQPLTASLRREGQKLEGATDRKLPQHITILIGAREVWATEPKDAGVFLSIHATWGCDSNADVINSI